MRGDRKDTFNAALEQSEQFMRSAMSAGVATQPVMLFYAVTQAGWAVNAAAITRSNNDWRLPGGHGITSRNLNQLNGPLASLELQDNGAGSFTTVAESLQVASLPEPTALGDLWCLLPDVESFPLPEQGEGRLLTIAREGSSVVRGARTMAVLANLPGEFMQIRGDDPHNADWATERAEILKFLGDYPTLSDIDFRTQDGQPVGLRRSDSASASVPVLLGTAETAAQEVVDIAQRSYGWGGTSLVYPRVGGSERSAHPFLTWWAVLYALSQMARYEPKAWLLRTAIASSADASPIEHLLNRALTALPELIHRTIMEASIDRS